MMLIHQYKLVQRSAAYSLVNARDVICKLGYSGHGHEIVNIDVRLHQIDLVRNF